MVIIHIFRTAFNLTYHGRKDIGKVIANHTGQRYSAQNKGSDTTKETKVCVETAFVKNDYKDLLRFGNEKDVEQIEGNYQFLIKANMYCEVF